jgi:hypothetical protein
LTNGVDGADGGGGMSAFVVDDLRFAQAAPVFVDVTLLNGEKIHSAVHEVNEEEGFASIYDPQAMGDFTTTRKIALDLVSSVGVTEEPWPN